MIATSRGLIPDTPELRAARFVSEQPRPMLSPINDRQFATVLALDKVITESEAERWAARGELPTVLAEKLDDLPDDAPDRTRFHARMLLSSATTYERDHPLTGKLGGMLGYDAAALDDLWTRAGRV